MRTKHITFLFFILLFAGCKNYQVNKLIQKGNAYYSVLDYEQAITTYDLALSKNFQNNVARYNKALALLKTNQTDKALEELTILQAEDPINPEYRFQYAMCLYQQKKYEECISSLSSLLNSDETDKDILHFYRGICYFYLKYYIQALQDFDEIKLNKEYKLESNFWSGLIYERLNDWNSAIEKYENLLKAGKTDANYYFHLGICYDAKNELQIAKNYFSSAIEMNIAFTEAYMKRAYLKFKMHSYDDAIYDYTKVADNDSLQAAKALIGRSACNIMKNQLEIAKQDLIQVLAISNDDILANSLLNAIKQIEQDSTSDIKVIYSTIYRELNN